MSRFLRRSRQTDSGEETVWIAFSDFLTAVLTVFMLAAVALVYLLTQEQESLAAAQQEAKAAQARSAQFDDMLTTIGHGEQVRASMVTEVRDGLAARGIEVHVDSSTTVLRIPVDQLGFASGSSDIQSQHRGTALVIGQVLADVLATDERYRVLDTVFIEGHTDNVPMDGLHGGNWGLSANRAISLWRLWQADLPVRLDAMTGYSGEPLFSVSGYAESRPVTPAQTTDAERAANRRIDIRFTEHRLSEDEINAIRQIDSGG